MYLGIEKKTTGGAIEDLERLNCVLGFAMGVIHIWFDSDDMNMELKPPMTLDEKILSMSDLDGTLTVTWFMRPDYIEKVSLERAWCNVTGATVGNIEHIFEEKESYEADNG